MKAMRHIIIFALLAVFGCSDRPARIISVSDDDSDMNKAMAEARSTLDQFWTKRSNDVEGFQGLLKVFFTDPGSDAEGEHMWVQVIDQSPDQISGVVLSSPGWLKSVKKGEKVSFPPSRVSDWLYVEDGVAKGAFTVRLLRSRMSEKEQRDHDRGYPFRFD